MTGLVKNELIKMWKQTSYKVLIIVFAALILVTPLIELGLGAILDLFIYTPSDIRKDELKRADQAIKYDEGVNGQIEREYYLASADAYGFFIDNGMDDSWKYGSYFDDYYYVSMVCRAYELLADKDFTREEIFTNERFNYEIFNVREDAPYYEKNDIYESRYDKKTGENISTYYSVKDTVTDSELKAYSEKLKREKQTLENKILNEDGSTYINMLYQNALDTKAAAQLELDAAQIKYDENASDQNKYDLDVAKKNLECVELQTDLFKKLADGKFTPDDWQYSEVSSVLPELMSDMLLSVPQPESIYNARYQSYKSYLKDCEKTSQSSGKMADILRYSIDNDVKLKGMDSADARTSYKSAMDSATEFILILLIIAASQIISQEFSSGTIRLLLIRPKKRHKILTSKIFCLMILAGVMFVGSYILLGVECGALYGFGDLFIPELNVIGGKVVKISTFANIALNMLIGFVSVMLFSSFALTLSTLVRRSALPIAISLVLYISSATIITLLQLFGSVGASVLKFTIIPYVNFTIFTDTVVDHYVSYSIGYQLAGSYNPILGGVIVALHIALLTFFSYLAFTKKQIKN